MAFREPALEDEVPPFAIPALPQPVQEQTWPRPTLLGKSVPDSHWGILVPPEALST
jgi:hypothetical protein